MEDTIENPQNNHIIVDQGHSWDFHVVVFHPWEFSFFFVKYMFLAKAKRKGMDKKENMTIWAKKVGHNRGPPEQSYYWGSRWLMDYPIEKLFGCNVLIRF